MTEPAPPRGPVQGLADLSQELTRSGQLPTFVRGLVVGAFVGAAIAGSALLRRRGGRDRGAPSGSETDRGPRAR